MNIYKQAVRLGIRFNTSKGPLTLEQMYTLSVTALAKIVRTLKKQLNETTSTSDGLEFLDETPTKTDKTLELMFDIAKDIYITKRDERDAATNAADNKAHNEKILALVAKKRENAMENMTEEELLALMKN